MNLRYLLLLLLFSPQAFALISTYADPRTLDEMESLRLTLRVDGSNQSSEIDLTPLEKDFDVLSSNTSSQYRSINGQTQSWVEYQIGLRPKRSGALTIPGLKIGSDVSQAVDIQVKALDSSIKQAIEEMVFFENELSSQQIYVQSELIYTRRLFYSTSGGVQMYSDLPGAPEMKDAVVVTLGTTEAYNTERNGLKYGVVEQRFAIIPEKSGVLNIPGVAITSSIRLMKQGRVRRSGIRVNSAEEQVEVKSIPAQYPKDEPWLTATNVELVEVWEPQAPRYQVGEPLTRNVVARVTGNVASAIPPLGADITDSAFKQYPQAPSLADDSSGTTNIGLRTEVFSLLPSAAGETSIPAVTLTWWDTEENAVKVSAINAQTVTIAKNPRIDSASEATVNNGVNQTLSSDTDRSTSDATQLAIDEDAGIAPSNFLQLFSTKLIVGLILAAGLISGWVMRRQIGAWASQRWRHNSPTATSTLGLVASPKQANTALAVQIKTITKDGSPAQMATQQHQLMVKYVATHDGVEHWVAANRLRANVASAPVFDQLSRELYGASASASGTPATSTISMQDIERALHGYHDSASAKVGHHKTGDTTGLPELFPVSGR